MEQIKQAVAEFIAAIRDTNVYKDYIRVKEKVNEQPELKAQIDVFRLRNYELQNMAEDDEELFDKLEQFEQEYAKFRENVLVNEFLAAELAFCRLMQDINVEITEALDFE